MQIVPAGHDSVSPTPLHMISWRTVVVVVQLPTVVQSTRTKLPVGVPAAVPAQQMGVDGSRVTQSA